MLATLTSKGQITLPHAIRTALKLDAGAQLDFALQSDGSVRVVPVVRDPLAIGAVLPPPRRRNVSADEIRTAVVAKAAARFGRSP
jgi:AbrB family looped-hinge helix DNA binding protein